MGLRNQFLEGLGTANIGLSSAAKTIEEERQKGIRQKFIQDLPGLIQGDIGALAQRAERANEPQILQEIVQNQLRQKLAPKPFTSEVLQSQGLSPEQAQQISQLPSSQQEQVIKNIQNQKQFNFQQTAENRRLNESEQQQRKMFVQDFNKISDAFVKEDAAIKNVNDALKRGTLPDDAIVFNFIARNVSQEKGPLNEGDIQRLLASTGFATAQQLSNYLQGTTASKLTKEQREAFRDIVTNTAKNFEARRDDVIGQRLANSLNDFPRLHEGEKPDKSILDRARRFGFEYKDGSFVKKADSFEYTGDYATAANKTTNPKIRELIKQYQSKGQPLPPGFIESIPAGGP